MPYLCLLCGADISFIPYNIIELLYGYNTLTMRFCPKCIRKVHILKIENGNYNRCERCKKRVHDYIYFALYLEKGEKSCRLCIDCFPKFIIHPDIKRIMNTHIKLIKSGVRNNEVL